MSARPHGYARNRLDGCRCYTCGYARCQYDDNRNRAIAYGTWQPWADAEPVRAHIRTLQSCGMGLRAIAAAAGIDRKRLQNIITGRPERGTGPQEKVRPALATAVLAVEPTLDKLGSNTVIDGTGTTRRLQALVAMGWPQMHLAAAIGMTPSNFTTLITAARVTVRTALTVRGLYDTHWRVNPLDRGATPVGVTGARRRAAELGWPPVGAWDDDTIDDPQAHPFTGNEQPLNRDQLAELRRAEIEHLDSCGLTSAEIAARLDMSERHTRDVIASIHAQGCDKGVA